MSSTAETDILSPSFDLAPYVENYIDIGMSEDSRSVLQNRLLPAPGTSIAVGYGDVRGVSRVAGGPDRIAPICSIAGYWSRPKEYRMEARSGGVFVACFKPWGLTPFLRSSRFDLGDAIDRNLELADAIGVGTCNELFDRIQECRGSADRKRVMEEILRRTLCGSDHPDHPAEKNARAAVERIALSGGTIRVASLADQMGVGRKSLLRLFDREIGIAPKKLTRIIRFQRSLRVLKTSTSLAMAAHEIGYFDQAHFIREFHELSGRTPGDWLRSGEATPLGRTFSRSIRSSHLYNTIYE